MTPSATLYKYIIEGDGASEYSVVARRARSQEVGRGGGLSKTMNCYERYEG